MLADPVANYQPTLTMTVAGLTPVSVDQANALLVQWQHDLGPCQRPFGAEGWVLEVVGRPVSVAISASTVSATVAGLRRGQVVELARLCSAPDSRWATRPMLRLWRELAGPRWSYWPVRAAVSYSTRRHTGDLYRWDGWAQVTDRAGSSGGGTYSTRRTADHAAAGYKKLWIWRYLAGSPEPAPAGGEEAS
jgi:hypothetical protein